MRNPTPATPPSPAAPRAAALVATVITATPPPATAAGTTNRTQTSPATAPPDARSGLTSDQATVLAAVLLAFMGVTFALVTRMRRQLRHQQELLREKLKRELEQEKVYRTLFDSNPQPMWVFDLETLRFLAVNTAATDRYGYSREEFLRLTIKDIRPPEDLLALSENIARVTSGLDRAGIWRHRKKDGTIISVEITSHTLEFAGRPAELVLALDVTGQLQAEAALRERERAYATLLKNLTGMVYRCRNDADWTTTYVSEGCLALTGYSTEDLLHNRRISLGALIHPDDAGPTWEKCQRNLAAHKACSNEYRIRTAHGAEKWVWDQAQGIYNDKGELLCIEGFLSDITERRRAETGEREARHRHEVLVASVEGIVWEADAQTFRFTFVSQQAERLLGHPVTRWYEPDFWYNHLHPDDRPWVPDFCRRSTAQGQNHDFEYRLLAADGRAVWLRDVVTVVKENGHPRWLRGVMVDITQIKAAEEERRRTLSTLQLFIDSVPGYVSFVNSDQRYELVNPGYETWFGRPRDQIIGRRLDEMHPPDIYAGMRAKVQSALAGELIRYESEVRSPAGRHHWFDCRYIPRRADDGRVLGFFVLVLDVTERKEAELAARESRERLDSILASVAAIVWSTTPDVSQLLYLNPGAAAIYGRPTTDFFTHSDLWLEMVHPDDRQHVSAAATALVRGEPFAVDYRIVRPDGSVRWVRDHAQLIRDADGQPLRIDGIATDITAIRAAEEERIALERQIQQTQKLESLGVLAGGIAHDFNNLLTAVMGNVSLAMMELPPASPIRQHLLGAERATQRAADLARQMLAYSGKGRFVVQRVNLHEIVEEMLQMLQVSITKKAVLRFNFASQVPAVEADVTQIRQIILNLVINASDAIGDRSGVIAISTGALRCDRAYLDTAWLQANLAEGLYSYIEVADSGCGIPRDQLPRIFDPFFTTKFTGRGLGLAAVLGIVRGHKGAIKVYSEVGRGTTFKILLPAVAGAADLLASPDDTKPSQSWKGHGLALLVDDEETIRALGQHMLEKLGFRVLVAQDGREALALFQPRAAEITLVLLDLTMPHMDGEETFRELRRIRPDVCVVLSSGYSEQDVVQRFAGKGLAGFVPKPYAFPQLQAVLQRALSTPPLPDPTPNSPPASPTQMNRPPA